MKQELPRLSFSRFRPDSPTVSLGRRLEKAHLVINLSPLQLHLSSIRDENDNAAAEFIESPLLPIINIEFFMRFLNFIVDFIKWFTSLFNAVTSIMSSPATARRQSIQLSPIESPALWRSPRRKGSASRARLAAPTFCLDDFSPRNKRTPSPNKKRRGESRSDGSCDRNDNPKRKSPERAESNLFSDLIPESSPQALSTSIPFRLDPKLSSSHKKRTSFDSSLSTADDSPPRLDNSSRQLYSAFASCENSDPPSTLHLRRSPRKPKPPVRSYAETIRPKESKVNSPPKKSSSSSPVFPFLRPPQNNNAVNDSITLTPIIPPTSFAENNQTKNQHYHRSPHWSGQVRVNPFSPIPEKYLNPHHAGAKSSAPSTTPGRKRRSSFQLGPPNLPSESSNPLELAKKRPLIMKRVHFLQPREEVTQKPVADKVSPKDVIQATLNGEFGDSDASHDCTTIVKRKESPMSCQNDDEMPEAKRIRLLKRGRYREDFEEVSFLGSGSFGSVNVCLSRLDGCQYAIKSICPNGATPKTNNTKSHGGGEDAETQFLYGGHQKKMNLSAAPPTPRRDVPPSPLRRKKPNKRFSLYNDSSENRDLFQDGATVGSSHWTDSALRRILREVHALAALCNKADVRTFHIVRYFQSWLEDDGTLYLQTELCSATLRDEMTGNSKKGNLASTTHPKIDVHRQFKILREILLALELLHEEGMCHLDIKPENIFVKENLYKLGDFGLVHAVSKGVGSSSSSDVEEGDSRYMPKDLLSDDCKDLRKCDIFSLGATMYEVCNGQPLPSDGQNWQDLRNGKLSGVAFAKSPCLYAIIKEMMHPDPDKRPSASQLLSRKELSGDDGNFLLHGTSRNNRSFSLCHPKMENVPKLKRSLSWTL